jgi:class 3 adenylate cyclase/predicted ATPase
MCCSKCGADNREAARFCDSCGTELLARCPSCGSSARGGARFCDSCGGALSNAHVIVRTALPPTASPRGERRHLTVLFCDLVGSTHIASKLDPEEWRELAAAYHRASAKAVERFGGCVAKFLGDGVLAYFGWPEAHDDDPERAIRAGLAILEAISRLNQQLTEIKLSARVGIDSGVVVIGTGGSDEFEVFGETPNIAARVQAAAACGTVLITDATHRLISGLFVVEERGAQTLKGIERPLRLYHVVQPSGIRGRLKALAATHGLTPFIGRENELRLLSDHWQRVRDGKGHLALVIGEPGIGKSRLIHRFHELIVDTPHTWIEVTGAPFLQNTPLYPVSENLRRVLSRRGDESSEEQLAQLESALVMAGLNPSDAIPLIAPLVNIELPAKYPRSALSAEHQRRQLLALLVDWVMGLARVQPVVMVNEDLHWADSSTLELIQMLVEQGPTPHLLLLCTARPEFRAPWTPREHHTRINLNQLSLRNARIIVEQLMAHKGLAEDTVDAVVERTGGVPLFLEELTRAVLESGGNDLVKRVVPVSLNDSLMARLDRLGPAKEVAQIGAVIGGEFSYELIRALDLIAEQDLQHALSILTEAELLFGDGVPPRAYYFFKHALIRDAAYEALLKSRRRELHSRIAKVLVGQFSDTVASAPELVAHHYTEAGLIPQAIPYWQRAGEIASQRSACAEAISHLTKGLELLSSLPDSSERAQYELALQIALGAPLIATRGYAASAVEEAYARALELCRQMGDPPQLFPVLWGLSAFYGVRADLKTARELSEQLLRIAEGVHDPALLLEAHHALGQYLFFMGEFPRARGHFEQGISLYDPRQHSSLAYLYGQDPGMACLSYLSWTLWFLGYPRQALARSAEALTLASDLSHSVSLAFAQDFAAALHQLRREVQLAQGRAEAAIALSSEQGFQFWLTTGTLYRGWALAELGQLEEGILQMRNGLAGFRTTGAKLGEPYFLARLSEAYEKGGQAREGLSVLADALATVDNTGERFYEAEQYRLKGELILAESTVQGLGGSVKEDPPFTVSSSALRTLRPRHQTPITPAEAEAEACFLKALEIARKQHAKSLELRAATSLAHLWQTHGKHGKAHRILADIFGWFSEGFDTADLKDAKALLAGLSRQNVGLLT